MYKKGSDFYKNWLRTNEGKSFISAYNNADWETAKDVMNFAQSGNSWYTYDPYTQYNQYFRGNTPFRYRDVSQHYDLGDYVGAIQVLEQDGNNILYVPKTYFIDTEGNRVLVSTNTPVLNIPRTNQNNLVKRAFENNELVVSEKPKLILKRSANGTYEVWLDNKKRAEIDKSKTIYEAVQEAVAMFNHRRSNMKQASKDKTTNAGQSDSRTNNIDIDALIESRKSSNPLLEKKGGVLKAQSGILLSQNPEFTSAPIEVGNLTNPEKSLKNTEYLPLNGKEENFD